ncbi:hypothetical protein [Phyllobacterium endophyticum]|uniref:Uncharacterized protein n=1 Tax=Phyllobacterium endophyticum TaxID=1149773 RepID=A0A2P7ASE0_9HYPH|nr:hypothetical protein [Phyllobacterium endophyticum]MBB3236823.1 hypothetical protein [Phyllobacterium endophyticum]PSH57090.1 hypothetical protein CU100_17635 [Phyllobacterium endophyticum]TYR40368.1 hypothetical protein FY050_17670 [Phyllobacterium endophyticum]
MTPRGKQTAAVGFSHSACQSHEALFLWSKFPTSANVAIVDVFRNRTFRLEQLMKLFWVGVCIFAGVASAQADDNACADLNGAYEHTVNTGRYQIVSTVTGPGQDSGKLRSWVYFYDRIIYIREPDSLWLSYRRGTLDRISESGRPVFQGCSRLGTETINGTITMVFQADWQRNGARAKGKLWFSKGTGKLVQTERFFTAVGESSDYFGFLGRSLVDRYTYDRGPPPPLEAYNAYVPPTAQPDLGKAK